MRSRNKLLCPLLLLFISGSTVPAQGCMHVTCACPFLLKFISWFILLISSTLTLAYLILYLKERRQEKKPAETTTIKRLPTLLFNVLLPLILVLIPSILPLIVTEYGHISINPQHLMPLSASFIPLLILGAYLKFHKRRQHINHIMALASILPLLAATMILTSEVTECACETYRRCLPQSCDHDPEEVQRISYALEKNDTSICNQLRICRDICYQEFAEKRKDPAICEKIRKRSLKDDCYRGA